MTRPIYRLCRPVFVAACVLATLGVAPASAVTVSEIHDLVRAGVSDEVIVALIEADDERFELDAGQILELRAAGVSDRVLAAMLRSGRHPKSATFDAGTARVERDAPPGFVFRQAERRYRPARHGHRHVVLVSLPVLVPPVGRLGGPDLAGLTGFGASAPVLTGFGAAPPRQASAPPSSPSYWGWGGTLRPDAWGQPPRGSPASAGGRPPQ
jgi:hypothetical protein